MDLSQSLSSGTGVWEQMRRVMWFPKKKPKSHSFWGQAHLVDPRPHPGRVFPVCSGWTAQPRMLLGKLWFGCIFVIPKLVPSGFKWKGWSPQAKIWEKLESGAFSRALLVWIPLIIYFPFWGKIWGKIPFVAFWNMTRAFNASPELLLGLLQGGTALTLTETSGSTSVWEWWDPRGETFTLKKKPKKNPLSNSY